eukprot:3845267-Rhodomonas_salina.3
MRAGSKGAKAFAGVTATQATKRIRARVLLLRRGITKLMATILSTKRDLEKSRQIGAFSNKFDCNAKFQESHKPKFWCTTASPLPLPL